MEEYEIEQEVLNRCEEIEMHLKELKKFIKENCTEEDGSLHRIMDKFQILYQRSYTKDGLEEGENDTTEQYSALVGELSNLAYQMTRILQEGQNPDNKGLQEFVALATCGAVSLIINKSTANALADAFKIHFLDADEVLGEVLNK